MIKSLIILHLSFFSMLLMAQAGVKQNASALPYDLRDGDIVFQSCDDKQAKAVKAATNSKWSHVAIVFFHEGHPWVLEAVQPVTTTPLEHFIARSPKSFLAMRLKNASRHITPTTIRKATEYGSKLIGKNYDPYFQWSDDRIYCSELVWKIYQYATGIKLCTPRKLKSYNLNHPVVQSLIQKRYGSMSKIPMNEMMVAPSDIAESNRLIEVPRKDTALTAK